MILEKDLINCSKCNRLMISYRHCRYCGEKGKGKKLSKRDMFIELLKRRDVDTTICVNRTNRRIEKQELRNSIKNRLSKYNK